MFHPTEKTAARFFTAVYFHFPLTINSYLVLLTYVLALGTHYSINIVEHTRRTQTKHYMIPRPQQ